MKVSFDLRFAHFPCGGRTSVATLIETMVSSHPETSWRLYYNPGDPPQEEILTRLRVPGRSIDLIAIRHTCLSLGQHLEFLKIRDTSTIYHYLHFDLPLGMRGPKLVMTIHDLYPLVLPGYCGRLKRGYFRYLCQKNGLRAARIITVSECTKRDLLEHLGLPEGKIVVIPQGVAAEFHPIEDCEYLSSIRRRYQLPERFLLYCGNHKKHKNLERLLRAYARLPGPQRDETGLCLTGPITEESRVLQRLAVDLGVAERVRFLGMIAGEDLPALYNLAGLAVQPSLYEGFGLPLVEAMACGVPVVGARAGAIPEVVGPAGRLFDPYDIEAMADTLRTAIVEDLGRPQRQQESLRQARLFSWDKTAAQTYALYQRLAEERHQSMG